MDFKREMIVGHKCDFVLPDGDFNPENARCRFCGKGILEDVVLPEPKEEKPLEFAKYRSVHNVDYVSVIEKLEREALTLGEWVATNKIHGTNFSMLCSASEVKPCKRSAEIMKDEEFFNYQLVVPYLTKQCKEIQSYFGENVQVYFELFGGSYPHPDVRVDTRFERIQKGVFYCPSIDFRAIDIKVDDHFLDFDEMCEIAIRHKIQPIEVIKRGSFKEVMELSAEFEDNTYKQYGLPKIEGNISEGLVIRPVTDKYFASGRRCILKRKSKKFEEKKSAKDAPREQIKMTDEEQECFEQLSACLTDARVDNILSHGETVTQKDFGKLLGLVISDIIKEEKEENYYTRLDKRSIKKVHKRLSKEAAKYVKPVFLRLVEFV